MQHTALQSISDSDQRIIVDLVSNYGTECTVNQLALKCRSIFGNEITPGHYVALGFLIGHGIATESATQTINQITSLCQRQN